MLRTLIIFTLVFTSCVQYAEKEKHLIPDGYVGLVVIFFDQKDGTPKEYENGFRVYRIPSNGILKTQFSPNPGFSKVNDIAFVYKSKDGNEAPIPEYIKTSSADSISIFNGKETSINKYRIEEYIVDKYVNRSKYYIINQQGILNDPPHKWDSIFEKAKMEK